MKILWISRHYPHSHVRKKLVEILESERPRSGRIPVVIHFTKAVHTRDLSNILDTYEPDVVVSILPLGIQEVLVGEINTRGIRPLIRPIFRHRNLDDPQDENEEWEFQGFEEILELTVKTRTLYLRTEEEQAFEVAEIHRNHGELQEAIAEYTEAIRLMPKYSEALYQRGVLHGELGAYQESITDLTEVIVLLEDIPKAFYHRATAYRRMSEFQKAINDYTEAIRLRVELPDSFYYRGLSRYLCGYHQDAIDDFTETIRLHPQRREALSNRGNAYLQLGDHQMAIDDYTKAIQIQLDVESLFNRGITYRQIGQHRKAIDDYTKAIQIQPNDPQLFDNRAHAFDALNMPEQAQSDRSKAAELNLRS